MDVFNARLRDGKVLAFLLELVVMVEIVRSAQLLELIDCALIATKRSML